MTTNSWRFAELQQVLLVVDAVLESLWMKFQQLMPQCLRGSQVPSAWGSRPRGVVSTYPAAQSDYHKGRNDEVVLSDAPRRLIRPTDSLDIC